jgi:hypothetical protein
LEGVFGVQCSAHSLLSKCPVLIFEKYGHILEEMGIPLMDDETG